MSTQALTLAYSTCPNDTFVFHALAHGLLGAVGQAACGAPLPRVLLADIEELNALALAGGADVCKISAALWPLVRQDYTLLASGAALGRGNGPVLVTRAQDPRDTGFASIALPGLRTTAALLLERYGEPQARRQYLRFDRIAPAVLAGRVEAGVLIHEGRFTFADLGLRLVRDLGVWWEAASGLPLPLGVIVARRSLGPERIQAIDAALRQSTAAALQDPERPLPYVRRHAQELSDQALRQHITTFVTSETLDMGAEGRRALAALLGEADDVLLLPRPA